MKKKVLFSLKQIDKRLFIALLFTGLCQTLYITLRTFFLGQLPGEWSYSIAAQLSWINLIYEVLNEAIILPLYFFMGSDLTDKNKWINKLRSGLVVSVSIYAICSSLVWIFIAPLLHLMAVSTDILSESAQYIRIECIANVLGIAYSFLMVSLVSLGKSKFLYIMTVAKLGLSVVLDTFLVSNLSISMRLGVYGIGISNCISNVVLLVIALILINKCGYKVLSREKITFTWMKDFVRIGSISGIESLVRNIAYITMVSRMVNMVGEQGTYWVANNFIWGWLLLPINQLAEVIKQETARDERAVRENTLGYMFITTVTCMVWIVLIPLYKPFMKNVLGFENTDKLFMLVLVLLGFYIFYAYQNVFDATFYGRGKTQYMLFESIVTNSLYYGLFFVLYLTGAWTPSLLGIALMFGGGNVFDSVVSYLVYRHFRAQLI